MAEFELLNLHMSDQIANANCEGAKQALNDYLFLLEKYKDVKAASYPARHIMAIKC